MRTLIFILFFYGFLFSNITSPMKKSFNLNYPRILTCNQMAAQNPLLHFTYFKNTHTDQTYSAKFNKKYLTNLDESAKCLRTSFYLKYGSNGLGIFQDIMLFGTSIGSTSLYNLFSVSSNFLDITSTVSAGRLSNHLYQLSLQANGDNAFFLKKASKAINKYKNYNISSTIFGFLGYSTLIYTLISSDKAPDEDAAITRGLIVGGGFAIGAIVTKFLALNNLEKTGQYVQESTKQISDSTQKFYLNEFGKNLIKSSKNWKTGFWYKILASITPVAITPISSETEVLRNVMQILVIGEFIAGEVYQNWISPWNLYNAGENLEDLKEKIQYEKNLK